MTVHSAPSFRLRGLALALALAGVVSGLAVTHDCAALAAWEGGPPPVMLANDFRDDINLADYWVSEKYDGVRAWWDGERLLTRSGQVIAAPAWFTEDLPRQPLDGELWIGRGQFEAVSALVRRARPDDISWRNVRFMVFDLPAHPGGFDRRRSALKQVMAEIGVEWVRLVDQFRVPDRESLDVLLERTVRSGGEGLMLRRGDSPYRPDRSDDLLKFKPHPDADARVIGYQTGRGKYSGLVGALLVENADGQRFAIGSGLSDADRRNPPPLGSWITYRYSGYTERLRLPRFATYLRPRSDRDELR
ncbi:DNA ligase [Derxia gummosa]|uniref:DNA ligase n=1 Tax=Derxia gummosa DSM 723 TaxID=1121388 RepID=A0A8B6X3J3_9BURK|nr:DNA ligase [Derxia gummosa]